MIVRRGLGVHVDRQTLSAERLAAALRRVLGEPQFRRTAAVTARHIADAPWSPAELFTRYVEFSARHGRLPELELPAAAANLWQRHNLDLVAVVLVLVCVVAAATSALLIYCLRRHFGRPIVVVVNKKKQT